MRLADEVALVLSVQAGLLDPMPLSAVAAFRDGLPAALDRGVPDIARLIQETGALDGTNKRALIDMLRAYAKAWAPPKT